MSVTFISSAHLPNQFGDFTMYAFQDDADGKEHLALVLGKPAEEDSALVRVHSECLTGDALFSLRCDCGPQLKTAMENIAKHGSGVILYLRQEGRNIGLINKVKAYALQDAGADTVDANVQLGFEPDERRYDMCKDMLEYLGINQVSLMTNNPLKVEALTTLGIKVVKRIPIVSGENDHNSHYLETKRSKMGHLPN